MEFEFRLVSYYATGILLALIVCAVLYVLKFRARLIYRYPLTGQLHKKGLLVFHPRKWVLFFLRLLALVLMAVLVGRPQWIDPKSKIITQGVDIVIVLDVSGSMDMPHCQGDERSRIDVAKQEALHFVDKRDNDAFGLVVFGNDALSRCPLTGDKAVIRQCIQDMQLGFVDTRGTVLSLGIVTAINRLKHSQAKSKIMIVLTDGEPSPHDIDPEIAIKSAQQLGIKIYTIGIGDNQIVMAQDSFGRLHPTRTRLNKILLSRFASQTGGEFFEAKSAQDMRRVYDTIDQLETSEIEAPLFGRTFDWFMSLLVLAWVVIIFELIVSCFIWFGI